MPVSPGVPDKGFAGLGTSEEEEDAAGDELLAAGLEDKEELLLFEAAVERPSLAAAAGLE